MEEQIKKAVRFVRMSYLLFWMVPVVFVLVGETTDSWVGAYADDVRTTYYAETLSILLAAACVPLSLKLFAWVLYRRIDRAGIARALQLYVFWSGIRLVLLALPLIYIPMRSEIRLNKWLFYAFYPAHLCLIYLIERWGDLMNLVFG